MSGLGAPHGLTDIGREAKPPFAVLPDPSTLFLNRSRRLRAVAPGHMLESYLNFVEAITQAQHDIQAGLPPAVLPDAGQIEQALSNAMAPLSRSTLQPGPAGELIFKRLLEDLLRTGMAEEANAIIGSLAAASTEKLNQIMTGALTDLPVDNIAGRVLALAALQVHFSRLAAKLPAGRLEPVAEGACPVCGSAPMTSAVVGWPTAHNTRFCSCSLCGTLWHTVRVKCTLCGSTEGIGYHYIEGKPETIKAETCDNCGRYVKILYQVNDPALDPLSDDVASLDLDMLMTKEGWQRGGQNLFLLGY